MATLKLRGRRYWAKLWVPKEAVAYEGGKKQLEKNLRTSDTKAAATEAALWEAQKRAEWDLQLNKGRAEPGSMRAVYRDTMEKALSGNWQAHAEGVDPVELGIELEVERIADAVGPGSEPDAMQAAQLAALQDAARALSGRTVKPRREMEPKWDELTEEYLKLWATQKGLKVSNTRAQKEATFKLFGAFWGGKSIRSVRKVDAARFVDALRQMDPHWARSPLPDQVKWEWLQTRFGGRPHGMSDATNNRHMATLKSLWNWANERELCEGQNPFDGFHRRMREGVNRLGYLPWSEDELAQLWAAPPKRRDLQEVMAVAMYTGMRLNEIAGLTWGDIKRAEGVDYFQVMDAKTRAGNRQVPIHPALSWLIERSRGQAADRVWPTFNREGPGKKPGADAGREFSRYKTALGFTDRAKAFHSFRKTVTRQMERARVPENEWAEILGHEKGITYGVYNPDGLGLERKAEIIAKLDYPGLSLPDFAG